MVVDVLWRQQSAARDDPLDKIAGSCLMLLAAWVGLASVPNFSFWRSNGWSAATVVVTG